MEQNGAVKNFIQKNALTVVLQLFAVVVVVVNLWLASKLAPLAQDLAIVTVRVSAVEQELPTLFTNTAGESINQRLNRMESKIDRLLERQQ